MQRFVAHLRGESQRTRLTIVSAAFVLVLWLASLAFFPGWAVLIASLGPLLVFLAVTVADYRDADTPEGFFLGDRRISPRDLPGTFVVTNVGLFSSIFYSMVLSHYYGLRGMLYPLLGWFLGMYLYSRAVPRLIPFLRRGHTLHEFIAVAYGSTDRSRATLRVAGAFVTGTLYWLSIALEIAFAAFLFDEQFGDPRGAVVAASLIAGTAILYTILAGYRGVIRTDQIQYRMMFVGAVVLFGFSVHLLVAHPSAANATSPLALATLVPTSADTFLIGSMITVVLYQFCIMDMWQRSIAVAGNFPDSDDALAGEIRRMLFRRSVLPFLVLFICWYAMGIAVLRVNGPQEDPNSVLTAFMQLVVEQHGIAGVAIQSFLFMVFMVAVISTADSFLMALVQTVMYDIVAPLTRRGRALLNGTLSSEGQNRFIDMSRLALLGLGASAVLMAVSRPDFARSWLFMYALMFPLFPPVFYAILGAHRRFPFWSVLLGICTGFVASFVLGFYGTFTPGRTIYADFAPLAAVLSSWLMMLLGRAIAPPRQQTETGSATHLPETADHEG